MRMDQTSEKFINKNEIISQKKVLKNDWNSKNFQNKKKKTMVYLKY